MSDQPGGPAGPEGALQYRSMTTAASDQLLSTKYRDWQCEEGWRGWFKLVPADPQHADAQLALWKRRRPGERCDRDRAGFVPNTNMGATDGPPMQLLSACCPRSRPVPGIRFKVLSGSQSA
jgi:hypothetical protein